MFSGYTSSIMANTITSTKTRAVCRVPLIGCLQKASEYKSLTGGWVPKNDEQRDFLRHLETTSELSAFSKEEFDSIASEVADEINKWLCDNGFTLKCPEIQRGQFATASFVKMFVKWLEDGSKTFVHVDDKQYPAVSFKDEIGKNIHHMGVNWGVTCLSTKENNTQVYCAMRTDAETDFNALSEEQLLDVATALESSYALSSKSYKGVRVPMIDLDVEVNQVWLRGIQNEEWFVAECLQQFILKLNEKGATAKSAAVMLISRSAMISHTPVLTFDKPFLLWFSRDGLTYPAFLAVCGTDCWGEPANLD